MNPKYQKIFNTLGKNKVKLDEPLSRHTTFGIGGPADLFYEAKTSREVVQVVKLARDLGTPFFILGGGSNILAADEGFRGLVIKVAFTGIKIIEEKNGFVNIQVQAGHSLGELLVWATKNSLAGLEFVAGIPGTFGGAVRGNAGAWQQSISKLLTKVEILNEKGEITFLGQDECGFDYRTSRFKKTKEIILSAGLVLEKGNPVRIRGLVQENRCRRSNQPAEPSAGCIFVNPKPKPAGELIDRCGLKNHRIGEAVISPNHANFIVNLGGAKAADVLGLINLAKREVKEKFSVDLAEEIQLVGFEKADKHELKRS